MNHPILFTVAFALTILQRRLAIEDDSWVRGQCEGLQARLSDGLSVRAVQAASQMLAETLCSPQVWG